MSKFTLSDALPDAQSSLQNPNLAAATKPTCPQCNSTTLFRDEKICAFCARAAAAQGSAADGGTASTGHGYPDAGAASAKPSGAGVNAADEAGSSAPPAVGSNTLSVHPESKRSAPREEWTALSVLPPPKRSRGGTDHVQRVARREAPVATAAVSADSAMVALSSAAPHGEAAQRKPLSPRTCAESLAAMVSAEIAVDAADDDDDLVCATLDAPAPPVTAREDAPHPDDAPPDEAIGQRRCDEPPVRAASELELADEWKDTETTRCFDMRGVEEVPGEAGAQRELEAAHGCQRRGLGPRL